MDLAKLLNREPYGCAQTTIGELCLFGISAGDQSKLFSKEGRLLAEENPQAFIRELAQYVYYPPDRLREDKYKPEKPVLGAQDLAALTDEDLEAIASYYLANHDRLYKERLPERSKNDAGETVVSFRYGDIRHPRQDGESPVSYLARLLRIEAEELAERNELVLADLRKHFSSDLSESIKRTQVFGDSIRDSLKHMRTAFEVPVFEAPKIDTSVHLDVLRNQERARWEPFKMLAKRIDALSALSKTAMEFAIEENKIQTGIATELKSAGDENRAIAKYNIRLSSIVIGLTVLGLVVAAYQIRQTNAANIEEQRQTQAYVEHFIAKLDAIRGTLEADDELRQEMSLLKRRLEEGSRTSEQLNAVVKQQARRIEELEGTLKGSKREAVQ